MRERKTEPSGPTSDTYQGKGTCLARAPWFYKKNYVHITFNKSLTKQSKAGWLTLSQRPTLPKRPEALSQNAYGRFHALSLSVSVSGKKNSEMEEMVDSKMEKLWRWSNIAQRHA